MPTDVYPASVTDGHTGHDAYHNAHTADTQDHKNNVLHPDHVTDFPDWSTATAADGAVPEWDTTTGKYIPVVGTTPADHAASHAPGGTDEIPGLAGSSNALLVIRYDEGSASWPLRATVTTDPTQPVRWEARTASAPQPPSTVGYAVAGKDSTVIVNT